MPMSFDVGFQRCRLMALAIGNMYISIFESCSCNKEILWNDMNYICSISTTIRILENESQDLRTPSQETGRSLGSSKRRLGWISLGRSTAPHRDKTAKLWMGKPCHQFGWLKNLFKHILGIVHPPYQLETIRFFVHPIHKCPHSTERNTPTFVTGGRDSDATINPQGDWYQQCLNGCSTSLIHCSSPFAGRHQHC